MKKSIYAFLIFQLSILNSLHSQDSINAEITYIGNEGFMISNNGNKVFIDALYYYSFGLGIMNVDASLRQMIINNQEPFSNSQLFLVTHNHPDHYDKTMVSSYLTNNPQAKMVAPSEIITGISSPVLARKLININPAKYESVDTTINGIKLTIYNFLHDVNYRIYNLGYFANIGGLKIFHGGDNSLEDSTEYLQFNLNEKKIDVLFLFSAKTSWESKANRDFIKKHINPKYIILMHIPVDQVSAIKEEARQINELDSTFPPIIVFDAASMEKVSISDTLIMSNKMPEKVENMGDTTVLINTPINIKVPYVFKDTDLNDRIAFI